MVVINLGAGQSGEPITEKELFKKKKPDIFIQRKKKDSPLPEGYENEPFPTWYKDKHYISTIIFSSVLLILLFGASLIKYFVGFDGINQ